MCIENLHLFRIYMLVIAIQNMQVNTFTLCLVHLQQHRETGWRRMVVILLFDDTSVSYSDDLIQVVQFFSFRIELERAGGTGGQATTR